MLDLTPSVRIGPYTLMRALGAGSFARTYEARHGVLGTKACLKVGRDARDNDLLLNEARVMWDLHHPSLPTVRDVFTTSQGTVAIAMRYVEGTPLEELRPIDVPTAARVFGRLLRALRLLHHRGILHNDVKPANIIVEPDRQGVVLVDFGVSSCRPRSGSRAPGLTPAFAAPEVTAGSAPLPESDIYSLGLSILWALGADTDRRALPSGVPEDFLQLLVRVTRRDPATRPRWGHDDPMRQLDALLPALV